MTISVWTLLVLLGLSGSFGVVFGCVVASKPAWAEESVRANPPQEVIDLADQR